MILPGKQSSSAATAWRLSVFALLIIASYLVPFPQPAAAASEDADLCLKGPGSPSKLIDACNRALNEWFVGDALHDNLIAARAYHYIDADQPQLAMADLNDVLGRHPKWARSLNDRCLANILSKQYPLAINDCDAALAVDPSLAFAYKNKARAHAQMGEFATAAGTLGRYLSKFPTDARAYLLRGEYREKAGELQAAEADYREAARRDPSLMAAQAAVDRLQAARVATASTPALPSEWVPSAVPAPASSAKVAEPAVPSRPAEPSPQLIKRLQVALGVLEFNIGQPNGQMGRRTVGAVAAYKRSARLPAEAPLDEAFVASVEAAAEAHARAVAAANAEAAKQAEARKAEAERQRQAAQAAIAQARAEATAEAERKAQAQRQQAAQAALAAAKAPAPKVETEAPTAVPEAAQAARKALPASAPDPSRIALVIGNSGYLHAPTLPNPRNDADDVAALLGRMGFTVMSATDLDRSAMEDVMIRFAKAAAKAEIAVTYYAGHGLQVDGTNYLVPIDADIEDELDLRRLIRLDDMVRDTGRAERFGFVMVDACRDNPFEVALSRSLAGASRSTGLSRGLAAPTVPARVLVTFATAATQTAADGRGRNSPFAAGVLQHLAEPDDIRIVVGRIVDAVAEATQQRQRPDMWGSLGGERIFLVKPEAVAEALDAQLTPPERAAVLSSLARLGMYSGPLDGTFSPSARRAIRDFQVRSGASPTGSLTIEQMIALYDQGRLGGPVEPLPPVDIVDLLRRSESGAPDAELLRAKVFDRNYETGPLPKDMSEAARWYRKAAEAGDADAALALGLLLQDGDGVELDLGEARRWLAAAARTGSTEAQYRLALLYLDDTDAGADRSQAIRLLKQAAQSNSGEAIGHLRQLKAWDPP